METNKVNIEEIANRGTAIYEKIKTNYEPQDTGKFLAIDVDTQEVFMGDSSSDAVKLARLKKPGKVFYVVKIGFSAVEVLSKLAKLQVA